MAAFVEGMMPFTGIEVTERTHDDRIWKLKLPDGMHAVAGSRAQLRVTVDKELGTRVPGVRLLDATHPLLRHLLEVARI